MCGVGSFQMLSLISKAWSRVQQTNNDHIYTIGVSLGLKVIIVHGQFLALELFQRKLLVNISHYQHKQYYMRGS